MHGVCVKNCAKLDVQHDLRRQLAFTMGMRTNGFEPLNELILIVSGIMCHACTSSEGSSRSDPLLLLHIVAIQARPRGVLGPAFAGSQADQPEAGP